MVWIKIPNEVVSDVTGRPIKRQVMDNNLEPVFLPIVCTSEVPNEGEVAELCDFTSTNLTTFNEHILEVHGLTQMATMVKADIEDATVARLLLDVVGALRQQSTPARPNLLEMVRKSNDSFQAGEVWRRAWNARVQQAGEVHLKKDQYDWLHGVLLRSVPLAASPDQVKVLREQGMLPGTVLDHIFGLDGDSVQQAFMEMADPHRRKEEPDPEEPTQ